MLPETVRTPRLVLRRPRPQDAATIFERYARDPEVTRYLTFRPHRQGADTEDFIAGCLAAWADGTRRPWVLTRVDDDTAIGMLDLRLADFKVDVGNLGSARVLEKTGMQREGLLRRYMAHPNVSAEPRDVYLYAKTREIS